MNDVGGGTPALPPGGEVARLTRRADFLAAAAGRRFHTEQMTAQGLARPGQGTGIEPDGLRVGLTVTKRVGHATERNRIKRRLRSVVAKAAPDLPRLAADIVLVLRRPSLYAPFDQLVQDLRRAVDAVTKPRSEHDPAKRPPRDDARRRRGAKTAGPPRDGSGVAASASTQEGTPPSPPLPPREPV